MFVLLITWAIGHDVDPAGDPEVSFLVALCAVARHVIAGEFAEVRLLEALVVTKHGAHDAYNEVRNRFRD